MRGELRVPEGGRAFDVYVRTYAHATVPVVLTAEDLARIAGNLGVPVDELTSEDLREVLVERAVDRAPTLGICCSGGNWPDEPSLALGDDWETADEYDASAPLDHTLVERERR